MGYKALFFDSKCSKFNVGSENARKNQENVFSFLDNCIWNGSGILSVFLIEFWDGSQCVEKES